MCERQKRRDLKPEVTWCSSRSAGCTFQRKRVLNVCDLHRPSSFISDEKTKGRLSGAQTSLHCYLIDGLSPAGQSTAHTGTRSEMTQAACIWRFVCTNTNLVSWEKHKPFGFEVSPLSRPDSWALAGLAERGRSGMSRNAALLCLMPGAETWTLLW